MGTTNEAPGAGLRPAAVAPLARRRDWSALVFALTFPTVMAWLYFVFLPGEGGKLSTAPMIAYGAGKVLQFAFPAVYVWIFDRGQLRPAPPNRQGLALGLAFGLMTAAVILGLYHFWLRTSPLAAGTPEKIFHKLQEFRADTPARFAALALGLSVGHSLLEEYYWRWFVFGRLRCYLALPRAVLVSSLGFMAHHVIVLAVYFPGRFWTLALPLALGVAVGGAVWAWIYARTRSLYAPWLSHGLIDLAIMAVGYQMIAGAGYW